MDIPIISMGSTQAIPVNKASLKKGFVAKAFSEKSWKKFFQRIIKDSYFFFDDEKTGKQS